MNPLINIPESSKECPIHILITKPGAIAGTEAQREEIAAALPKAMAGNFWQYQPIAVQPLRFATMGDGDKFMDSLEQKKPTDEFFVAPMIYDQKRKRWAVNKEWAQANGELVVFMQQPMEQAPATPAPLEPCN